VTFDSQRTASLSRTPSNGDPVLCPAGTVGAFGCSSFPRGAYFGDHLQGRRASDSASAKDGFDREFDRLILPGAMVPALTARVISVQPVASLVSTSIGVFAHSSTTSVPFIFLWPKPQTFEQRNWKVPSLSAVNSTITVVPLEIF